MFLGGAGKGFGVGGLGFRILLFDRFCFLGAGVGLEVWGLGWLCPGLGCRAQVVVFISWLGKEFRDSSRGRNN